MADGQVQCNVINAACLIALPAVDGIRAGYFFAGLPLHYLDSGWALSNLGATLATASVYRVLVLYPIVAAFGPWTMAPFATFVLCMTIPVAIWPDVEAAVMAGTFVASAHYLLDAHQTLSFGRFTNHEKRQQASRVITLAGTIGYAVSPFIGGLLFDLGKWPLSAIFQLLLICVELILLWTSPPVWDSWRAWRNKQDPQLNAEVVHQGHEECGTVKRTSTSSSLSSSSTLHAFILPPGIRWPACMIGLATCANGFSYYIEWSVFAAYFRQEFNWTSSWWAGAAQMSGDILGATILAMLGRWKQSVRCRPVLSLSSSRCVALLFSAPYNMSVLLCTWVILQIAMSLPVFIIAVAAQVLMGTLYVFSIQCIYEMNALFAAGNAKIYSQMQWVSSTCFGIGTSCAPIIALPLYEHVNRLGPFYAAACGTAVAAVIYTLFFWLRGEEKKQGGAVHLPADVPTMTEKAAAACSEMDRRVVTDDVSIEVLDSDSNSSIVAI